MAPDAATAAGSPPIAADLPPLRVGGRAASVREILTAGVEVASSADAGGNGSDTVPVEALVLTNLANGRWLTGFSGSAMVVVLTADDLLVITDGRYATQAPAELSAAGVDGRVVIANRGSEQQEAAAAAVAGLGRVALEAEHVSWSRYRRFAGEWFGGAELVPSTGVVERLRRRKSPEEVARVAAAAAVADGALAEVLPRLAEGPTEGEVAAELDHLMRRRGASGSAFDTIVAAGENSALPHARPGPRRIEPGDLVVIDFGAIVDGYRSDMTRTVCVGEPRAPGGRVYEVVRASQQAGVEAVADGVSCKQVDAVCREIIDEAGWGEAFLHSTGHGVGLDIHEAPSLSSRSDEVLAAGEVVTVEPGVYLAGTGGVRIEDTVVVTDEGCRRLTCSPKTLVVA
ncbi:MAG: aminopeptidase P family protein [Acidimicrobiia bacterium]|nr:aminopeptidase P family protein [Acidimicrobiia bacterium]MYC45094.1 aminopeptidase P family protein [Acidimicrobiia bacterium]MYI20303.1 aminopeptidase P family protein [Acidimicrobiia bacterium]